MDDNGRALRQRINNPNPQVCAHEEEVGMRNAAVSRAARIAPSRRNGGTESNAGDGRSGINLIRTRSLKNALLSKV